MSTSFCDAETLPKSSHKSKDPIPPAPRLKQSKQPAKNQRRLYMQIAIKQCFYDKLGRIYGFVINWRKVWKSLKEGGTFKGEAYEIDCEFTLMTNLMDKSVLIRGNAAKLTKFWQNLLCENRSVCRRNYAKRNAIAMWSLELKNNGRA